MKYTRKVPMSGTRWLVEEWLFDIMFHEYEEAYFMGILEVSHGL